MPAGAVPGGVAAFATVGTNAGDTEVADAGAAGAGADDVDRIAATPSPIATAAPKTIAPGASRLVADDRR